MQSFKLFGRLGGAAVGALLVAVFAGYRPAAADEPGVARLSVTSGDVAIRRGDSSDTFAANVNSPLMASDYLSTGNGSSHAEVQFNYGTFLRLGSGVQLRISQIDSSNNVVQLAAGTVLLSELHGTNAHTEIDTPSVAVRPNGVGQYRVTVNPDGSTLVNVRNGSVSLAGTSNSETVSTGDAMIVTGPPSNPQYHAAQALALDSFDQWNISRDSFDGNDAGYQYAPNQIVGIPDLSQYGSWNDYPQYGYGWTPNNVGSTWSPYQNGQWVWEPYYGWTWVGNESWGWAPYHYGTWMYNNSAWTWYPNAGPQYPTGQYPYIGSSDPYGYSGTPYAYGSSYPSGGYPYNYGAGYPPYATGYPYGYGYPYPTQTSTSQMLWAPALVAFLGLLGGENPTTALLSGLSSASSLAWTPLAPGEPAYPWWGPQQSAWYGYPSTGYTNYQTNAYGYANAQPAYVQGATQPALTNSYNTYEVTKIVKIYRNVKAPHGVLAISGKAMRSGQFSNIRPISLEQAHLSQVAVFRNVVPVAPTTANLHFARTSGPTRIAAIAPKPALFAHFSAPKREPTQFATVRSKVTSATDKLYSSRPTLPGPYLTRHVLTAPKPPATAERNAPATEQREATARRPETTTVERKPQTTTTVERKPQNEGSAWQQYDRVRGTPSSAEKPAAKPVTPEREQAQPERQQVQPNRDNAERSAPSDAWQRYDTTRNNGSQRSAQPEDHSNQAQPERQTQAQPERQNQAQPERQSQAQPKHRTYQAQPEDRSYQAQSERQSQAQPQHRSYQAQPERQSAAPAERRTAPATRNSNDSHASNSGSHSNDKKSNRDKDKSNNNDGGGNS